MNKTCSKCSETKPLDRFSKNRGKRDGLQVHCKACEAATGAAWYAANRERQAATGAAWHAANREQKAETNAAWYAANREQKAATSAAWYAANPEKVKAIQQRRRARKANAAGTFTSEQWLARLAYHENKCVYCGSREDLQIEHQIPLARGGTNWSSNLVPACGTCNRSKGTKTPKEFLDSVRTGWGSV
jgi:5-methylcytosine-specific restriction endonuclease McrA